MSDTFPLDLNVPPSSRSRRKVTSDAKFDTLSPLPKADEFNFFLFKEIGMNGVYFVFFFCFIAKRVLHIGWNFIENLLGFFWGGRNLATAQVQSWLEKRLVLDIFFCWRKFNGFKVDWILESAAFAG